MKKILLISIALLFGYTLSAQTFDAYPNTPYANYEYAQMNPDYNDPPPWGVINKLQMLSPDYNDPQPWGVLNKLEILSPDGMSPAGYPNQGTIQIKPPVNYYPNIPRISDALGIPTVE